MPELRSVPCACTADPRSCVTSYQRSLGTPHVSKWGGKFDFQYNEVLLLFFGVLSRIFSAKLSNSVEFLLRIYLEMMESIDPQVHWEMCLSFQVCYPAALLICSATFFLFFKIKVIYCRILLISLSVL